jgi:hypothetical protein
VAQIAEMLFAGDGFSMVSAGSWVLTQHDSHDLFRIL